MSPTRTELRDKYMEHFPRVAINDQDIVIGWDRSGYANDGRVDKIVCESLGCNHRGNFFQMLRELSEEDRQAFYDRGEEHYLGQAQKDYDEWVDLILNPPPPPTCSICHQVVQGQRFYGACPACAEQAIINASK